MRKLFDFTCDSCGHTHERLVDDTCHTDPCPKCDGVARRIISPVRCKLDGTDPSFPGAYDKWARDHERWAKQAAKKSAEHGE
jgi:putative FmdB family regulatory protein